ncbi:type II toxin-antitoxin system RelE/ParE family toxin [Psychroflexus gondwanensis]|uniref:type II toxin-antitoxin system RelE/ParE family toxin n=1 Tax=Psychroflexus gondwanensis TaxID=251 RepID=UPI0011BDFEC1|nr:type II toxin-antitoxin system RelE/ParE family toxin [Psychroflexus gondwanensis]TXE20570.1 type II toxin-antitoxin system RelE/ParE family toxin [Psychroflexus gondwanensis]
MADYKVSTLAKEDLIKIHRYGVQKFGMTQADKYFNFFFEHFNTIAKNPFSFESFDYIKTEYRPCICGSDSISSKLNTNNVEIMVIIGKQDLKNIL